MNITIEALFGIAIALGVPLLGTICTVLWSIKSTIDGFNKTLEKAEKSLDHNRDEHTKLIALINSMEKSLTARIDLLEERIRHEE